MIVKEIEIKILVKRIWRKRKFVLGFVAIFAVLGLAVAFSIKNQFTATSIFIPQSAKSSKLPGNIGGLASLAGIQLGGGGGADGIPTLLYPKVLNSLSFDLELLEAQITVEGLREKVSYREYYEKYYEPSIMSYLKRYTIGLPGLILKSFRSDSNDLGDKNEEYIKVSVSDLIHINRLRTQIGIVINEEEGFVNLGFTIDNPLIAAEMAAHVERLLQEKLIEYKIDNSRVQLEYVIDQYNGKQIEYHEVQRQLAEYQDGNKNLFTASSQSRLLELQSNYDLILGVYNELAKQVEQAKLQVSKNTPVFSVIDPISIPSEKSGPGKIIILIGFVFLGVVCAVLQILLREFVTDFLKYIRED